MAGRKAVESGHTAEARSPAAVAHMMAARMAVHSPVEAARKVAHMMAARMAAVHSPAAAARKAAVVHSPAEAARMMVAHTAEVVQSPAAPGRKVAHTEVVHSLAVAAHMMAARMLAAHMAAECSPATIARTSAMAIHKSADCNGRKQSRHQGFGPRTFHKSFLSPKWFLLSSISELAKPFYHHFG